MQVNHQPTKILLLGRSGTGKTTYLIRYIQDIVREVDFVFIFDHKREFQTRLNITPSETSEQLLAAMERGDKFISYSHETEWPGLKAEAFQFYCEWVFEVMKAYGNKRCFMVCDEVNRFTTAHDLGWEFQQLIEDGRLRGIDFVGTAHNANRVNGQLRAQLTEIVALKTTESLPLGFLEECGFDIEAVRALPIGAFIAKNMIDETFESGRLFTTPTKAPVNEVGNNTIDSEPTREEETEEDESNP